MRILYAITKANWGGAQRYVYDLATAAVREGHEVAVVYGSPGRMVEELKASGVRTIQLPEAGREVRLSSDYRAYRSLLQILKEERPDVLHLNSSKIGGIGALAGRVVGIGKIIFTAHGWAFNEKRPVWQKGLIWLSHWSTLILSHTVLCVSKAVKDDVRSMPFVNKKCFVVHNGIAAPDFFPRHDARSFLVPGLDPDVLIIGTIAELHPTKNIDILLEAFSRMEARKDAHLVLIGDGDLRAKLETLARSLGIAERTHFLGHVAEASRYLAAFDLFTLASHSEALAYAVLEAGSAGLPVVASMVGGLPEVIEHEKTGLLVVPDQTEPLARALDRLATDRTLAGTLGESLKVRVATEFSVGQMLKKTFSYYST